MICNIKNLKLKDKILFGGKASTLGELFHNNIVIPNGFALSIQIFDEFLQYNSFPFSISEYLSSNKLIQAFILEGKFPDKTLIKLNKSFRAIFDNGNKLRFVVRSSAICEDTKSFSMAGMFSSYVKLTSFEEVIEAIKKCYASLFEDKVLSYAINNNIDFQELKMGVVIQEFIEGNISGVNFSADVIEMNCNTVCINMVEGICENYVSGKVSSLLIKMDKEAKQVISNNATEGDFKPSNKTLNELLNCTLEIEKIFDCFQDIEWTFCKDKLYILQSRPVTTFKNKQFNLIWEKAADAEYQWWLGPPIPFPPLVLDICPIEEEAFLHGAYTAGYAERNTARTIQNGYIYFRNKHLPNAKEKREKFFYEVDLMTEQGINIFLDILMPRLDKMICKLNQYLSKDLLFEELAEFLDLALEYLRTSTSFHWPAEGGIRYIDVFKKCCNDIIGKLREEDFYDLIYIKSVKTKEREMLFEMVKIIKDDEELTSLFNSCHYDEILYHKLKSNDKSIKLFNKMEIYLQKFGACNADYEDYIPPVLIERPEGILKKLRTLFEVDAKVFFNSIENIIRNKQRILERISKVLSEKEYLTFQKRLNSAEKAFLVTDTHNYYIERLSWGYLRLAVIEAAKAMKSKHIINNTDEVFFLTFEELKKSLKTKKVDSSIVIERKKLFQNQKKLLPPKYIGKDFTKDSNLINRDKYENVSNSSATQFSLKGIATFKEKIKGKIIKGIPQSFDEDCILVVFHGHASDITHLLAKVKGLIFENGSPFDHLGIISREMNIPAIYYVNNALSILNNGDLVEIDGVKGEINILKY